MTGIEARSAVGREGDRSERYGEHHLRVVVIGAGFSGLSVASRLRERGEEDFVVLERGKSVGGVWRDNTYPGWRATCRRTYTRSPSRRTLSEIGRSRRGRRSKTTSNR